MNTTQYPPPIRLAELVEAVGVDGVRAHPLGGPSSVTLSA